jgi:hypothetical protein
MNVLSGSPRVEITISVNPEFELRLDSLGCSHRRRLQRQQARDRPRPVQHLQRGGGDQHRRAAVRGIHGRGLPSRGAVAAGGRAQAGAHAAAGINGEARGCRRRDGDQEAGARWRNGVWSYLVRRVTGVNPWRGGGLLSLGGQAIGACLEIGPAAETVRLNWTETQGKSIFGVEKPALNATKCNHRLVSDCS